MNTVVSSMVRQGLQSRAPKRKRRGLTRPDKAAEPIRDLVKRDFNAEAADQKVVWRPLPMGSCGPVSLTTRPSLAEMVSR